MNGWDPSKPRPKSAPLLSRKSDGSIDPEEVKKVNAELLSKFVRESAHVDKENSFHVSRTGKRDIVVHMAITILPQVDGRTVVNEVEKEMCQYCFVIPARATPWSAASCTKGFAELFHRGRQVLLTMGVLKT